MLLLCPRRAPQKSALWVDVDFGNKTLCWRLMKARVSCTWSAVQTLHTEQFCARNLLHKRMASRLLLKNILKSQF